MPPLQCDASTRIGAVQLYDRVGGEGVALGALVERAGGGGSVPPRYGRQ